ncbi:TIGR01244 family sulfur transferase [Falsiphaeobacter marinintestinus]|uniref:TIGR01244 family sulfur transferase n=1 Tax=Falsiphaeobacter marinintestinus TaxID=1492905 RepID=UPI0011B3DA72|nr:TIGR01244 family sulfur transferase [Phaeobacter marinintestinus]
MDIRHITPDYAVSPQITAEDAQAIADAGFKLVICNRPDAEVTPDLAEETIRAAVEAAGLRFEALPLTQETMTLDNAARHRALMESAEGPVLAYCRTGTRCSVVWALGHASILSPDDILSKTSAAGYQLDQLRPTLTQIAGQ